MSDTGVPFPSAVSRQQQYYEEGQHRNWNLTKTIREAITFMERDVARHFTEMVTNGLGAANTTEFLFVANPIESSLIRGTLNVLGLENVSFEARMTGPPLRINVLNLTVAISFNPILRAFTGSAAQAGAAPPVPETITIRAPS